MQTLQEFKLDRELAKKYLKIYNADIDWNDAINSVRDRIKSFPAQDQLNEFQKRLACAILLPYYEKNTIQNPPQNLLFFCHKWNQYNSRDWIRELCAIIEKDKEIEATRAKCLAVGVAYPLQYNPNSRQAFNWLYDEAAASGDVTEYNKDDIVKKLQNVVYAYGGAVVCSVFEKLEYKTKIKNICNWRSGYFFEKLIYEIYKPEEIIKIKTHEINRIRSNDEKLVKMIKTKE